jgi:hypothetical protein
VSSTLYFNSQLIISSGTLTTTGRGVRKVVSLFESLSSIVEEADQQLIENDNFDGTEEVEEDSIVKRA